MKVLEENSDKIVVEMDPAVFATLQKASRFLGG